MRPSQQKITIVTGAARGIGAAIAERCVSEGHPVALVDIDVEACAKLAASWKHAGAPVISVEADVGNENAVTKAVEFVCAKLGPPQILINNAGFARDTPLDTMSTDDWDAVQNVHLRGAFLLSRAVQPFMAKDNWGRIVNISSTSALGHADRANYCAAKAGLIGLTRALAAELGPRGITVNAVAPGLIVTRMTDATAFRNGRTLQEHIAIAAASIPVRRVGRPEDISEAVLYFISNGAGYVTRQTLYVSGGPTS